MTLVSCDLSPLALKREDMEERWAKQEQKSRSGSSGKYAHIQVSVHMKSKHGSVEEERINTGVYISEKLSVIS